ncbi:hypothetical protein M409DRAFT_15639 [Zasmidium cellare ATCC 36951]|uniref:Uncharacterized protein n=1 Tax=Zasmidium cellare ATCC 36951 TaxID=1080233 RepID=A0A6A6D1P6_ZASCE|nr:uncharacterized protein M409DRAFT_15639 [Zasmidium cellare ATCC 36951]KAF2173354.1 hypothetical protein M409DRAFT_15639 [Zasmidium cellare ATCC 36951]
MEQNTLTQVVFGIIATITSIIAIAVAIAYRHRRGSVPHHSSTSLLPPCTHRRAETRAGLKAVVTSFCATSSALVLRLNSIFNVPSPTYIELSAIPDEPSDDPTPSIAALNGLPRGTRHMRTMSLPMLPVYNKPSQD